MNSVRPEKSNNDLTMKTIRKTDHTWHQTINLYMVKLELETNFFLEYIEDGKPESTP